MIQKLAYFRFRMPVSRLHCKSFHYHSIDGRTKHIHQTHGSTFLEVSEIFFGYISAMFFHLAEHQTRILKQATRREVHPGHLSWNSKEKVHKYIRETDSKILFFRWRYSRTLHILFHAIFLEMFKYTPLKYVSERWEALIGYFSILHRDAWCPWHLYLVVVYRCTCIHIFICVMGEVG